MIRSQTDKEEPAMKTEKLAVTDLKIKPKQCYVLKAKWRTYMKKEARHLYPEVLSPNLSQSFLKCGALTSNNGITLEPIQNANFWVQL